jgi:hypothetical protein
MSALLKRWAGLLAIAIGIVSLGFGLYALVTEPGVWRRFWIDLVERPAGPMSFRFMLQPTMAALAAWHDGARDAATGRSPYFWTVLTDPVKRGPRLREALEATGKILLIGQAMDLVYQHVALDRIYPMEAITVAVVLAFVPYLLLRGPACRIVAWWRARNTSTPGSTP